MSSSSTLSSLSPLLSYSSLSCSSTLSFPLLPSLLSPLYLSTFSLSYSSTLSFSTETLYMYRPIALQDPRVPMVIQYAVKAMFETATN